MQINSANEFDFFMIHHVELQPLSQGLNRIQPSFEQRSRFTVFFSLFSAGMEPDVCFCPALLHQFQDIAGNESQN
jgi:hypothetical protein